jgi:site-specific DNA recombinase
MDPTVFARVQDLLHRNGRTGGAAVRNKFGAFLKGLLRCGPCGCAMIPSYTSRGEKRYRYYVCGNAQKRGWDRCPSKSVPAAQIEQLVLDRIKCVGRDPALVREILAQARSQEEAQVAELETERRGLERDLARWHAEVNKLSGQIKPGDNNGSVIARLADLQERISLVGGRVDRVREQIQAIHEQLIGEDEATAALSVFDPVWGSLTPNEQARVIGLLVEQVDYDGEAGKVSIVFHAAGIKNLAKELASRREEIRA